MSTPGKNAALTLVNSSFPWLGGDGGYRIAGADNILWAHWLYGLYNKEYDLLGHRNLRRVERYCKKNNISFEHGMVKIKEIREQGGLYRGHAEVESRSKEVTPVYDVYFDGFIKKTDDTKIRRRSLRRINDDCGCWRSRKLLGKPVNEEVRNTYKDNRHPNNCKVTVSMCFHVFILLYELENHHGFDGYGQIGLRTQTDLFAKHELRYLLSPNPKPFEINNFLLKTNFFNPLRKILGIPLVV